MGYVLSVVTLRVRVPQGPLQILKNHDVTIWKRGTDGRWKIALDFASRAAVPTMEDCNADLQTCC